MKVHNPTETLVCNYLQIMVAKEMWTKHTCNSWMLKKVKSNTHVTIYTQIKQLF